MAPKKHLDNVVVLKNIKDQDIQLKASQLEHWFADAESWLIQKQPELSPTPLNTSESTLATQCLGRFGLQSSSDVISFLKSPAGESTMALLGKELAEMAAIDEQVQQDLLIKQRQHKRKLMFLLLGLLHKHEARAHRLEEEIQRYNEKRLHNEKEAIEKRHLTESSISYDPLTVDAYLHVSNAIEQSLDTKLVEAKKLEKELINIEKIIAMTSKKYTNYTAELDRAHEEIAQWTLDVPLTTVKEKISQLTAMIDSENIEISKLLDSGEDNAARDRMELNNARNLHVAMLLDMLSVMDGSKIMYTQEGERTQLFHEADFIIPLQKKIAFKNGKYYVLQATQNADNLSSDEKEQGEKAYLRLRPDIMGVKKLVQHNKTLEHKEHHEKKSSLLARSETMQQDILLLANQLIKIQASRANALSALPTPTPAAPSPTSGRTNSRLSQSYKHMIRLMNAGPTAQSIDWLKKTMGNTKKSKKLQEEINTLAPGKPISSGLMNQLLKRKDMGRLWLTPNKPDTAKLDLTPYATAPSPLTTKLKPLDQS